jgi:hypothetical protein
MLKSCSNQFARASCELMKTLSSLLAVVCLTVGSYAGDYVSGYVRSNGTYIAPHFRTSSNSTVRDNYSYKGNYNPYTGSTGTNYYRSSPSSSYYNGGYSGSTYQFRLSR